MQSARFLELMDGDFRRLRELAGGNPEAKVPTCPDWTLADLVEHVSMVYLHKVETMRHNAVPSPWPPENRPVETPAALLSRAYAALSAEFADRPPATPAPTWFEPDQTVGFWIRRMAHETVVHRVDGELAAGAEIAPIPDDLAADGIDEILKVFLEYESTAWQEEFADALSSYAGQTLLVSVGDRAWSVTLRPEAVTVADAEPGSPADATVTGDPVSVLLWLWRRADGQTVTFGGDMTVIAGLRELMRIATQ
jgi:uncharacterized protein (TIGR03083 family)